MKTKHNYAIDKPQHFQLKKYFAINLLKSIVSSLELQIAAFLVQILTFMIYRSLKALTIF